ncbi:membrane protein insertion efficiency factor YidD [Segnochrobactraceae bacterium EtOH-i3]
MRQPPGDLDADALIRAVANDVPERLRPRAQRALGLKVAWDDAVDRLPALTSGVISRGVVWACRLYRAVRPRSIGDRCAFEPSCSRYVELCFRTFPVAKAGRLSASRLCRCCARNGGLDIPSAFKAVDAADLGRAINEVQG